MKKKYMAVAALSALLLTSCSSSPEALPTATNDSSASTAPTNAAPSAVLPSPSSNMNERGQIAKKLGETGGIPGEDGELDLKFAVTKFEFVKCSKYAGDLNGRALAAHVEVETTGNYEGPLTVDGAPGLISFVAYHWRGYEPDGTRMNDLDSTAVQNCFESKAKLLPDYIGKGEKAKGMVLLDVTTKSGEVAFNPYGDGGWVWEYPGEKANV
ncbi:hypothetical protein [Paeniglutamicibacter kerguelensis]|uniref:DUF4352 domain-containing protein n=1 Tax=Paeniglutamicibacter kerguelensis TaxID=254788 RepID=A0ABS4XG62_9MICC|nr:hypothetical protein [Paeniglutamicibacter kerguelensis]MBP2387457.1 hypothetical protein [Paeniglutamicibacter kerguelensis]